jgi:cytochrome P450
MPRALLSRLPFQACKETYTALTNFTRYMQDLRARALSQIDEVSIKLQKNILVSILVAGADLAPQSSNRALPKESVLSNIFFSLMASHKTTSNSLAFAVILLAIYPKH